jgi:hypothetical protein
VSASRSGPTKRDIAVIRSLLERAGGRAALMRWIKETCPPSHGGRPKGSKGGGRYADYDDQVLLVAGWLRALDSHRWPTLAAAIKFVTSAGRRPKAKLKFVQGQHGPSRKAMLHRIRQKRRALNEEFEALSAADREKIPITLFELIERMPPELSRLRRALLKRFAPLLRGVPQQIN